MQMYRLMCTNSSYTSKNSRTSYWLTRIESWRDAQTMRRYMILHPPSGSNIRFFCCTFSFSEFAILADFLVPRQERIIAHSEHPEAYGSSDRFKVKFMKTYPLYSQKLNSSRKSSDASNFTASPLMTVSPATSIRSFASVGSPILTMNDGNFNEEARLHEYDFENKEGQYNHKQGKQS